MARDTGADGDPRGVHAESVISDEFERDFYQQRAAGELSVRALRELMAATWSRWYGDSMSQADDLFLASKLHFSIADVSFYN